MAASSSQWVSAAVTEDKGTDTRDSHAQPPPRPTSSQSANSASSEYFESVVSMLSILSCSDQSNAHRALLAITNSPESCQALRKAGCIPLLIQILHPVNLAPNEHPSLETKARAARALKNIVHFNSDEKQKRKEIRVLKLLESIRFFSEQIKIRSDYAHPVQSTTTLMKLSFDEEHRLTMCQLGAIHAIADLIQADHLVHGLNSNQDCIITRRYSGMTLTNLTFGDGTNKALLCSMRKFMTALVAQLDCPNEDVCQVTASVLRNLSWHADGNSRIALRDSNDVSKLTVAAIKSSKESTLKATLSALWNLSAHSVANKTAICQTENAIEFLIGLLNYKSKTLTIVENAGGILRNIAGIISTNEMARENCRVNGLLEILLEHLKSSSFTVVSNACGTLWHLSTNSSQDQRRLLELGALPKLKALMYSKHERIAHSAGAAFKNLQVYSNKNQPPEANGHEPMDLRRNADAPSSLQLGPSKTGAEKVDAQDEPLDLSMHSSKSSPIHIVSAAEFGARTISTPVFLNPPLQIPSSNTRNYYSPKNYKSCPELMRFIQPAHQTKALDCSKSETLVIEDTTTNYSLHFTESEDSPCNKNEDTIKTYYCEGTPLNFSQSNSMSDLTQMDRQPKLKPIVESEAGVGEDQLKKYFTEHTPANFSRCSSLSSIASNIQGGENKAEFVEEQQQQPTAKQATNLSLQTKEKVKRSVTFSANETPLMFSRSSSVNSLESVEVNYEDGGSVISEFSRRTSEAVSPSDLPDSPRQIAALGLSSFQEKDNEDIKELDDGIRVFTCGESAPMTGNASLRSLSPLTVDGEPVGVTSKIEPSTESKEMKPTMIAKPILKAGRSENSDELKIFAIEGTPFGVSNSTSLSDLVCLIEKEEEIPEVQVDQTQDQVEKFAEEPQSNDNREETEVSGIENDVEEEPIYSDAQILQKCINAGKASRVPKSKSEFNKLNKHGDSQKMKVSSSYHEDLNSAEVDSDLAELIMKGKNKARIQGKQSSMVPNSEPQNNTKSQPKSESEIKNKLQPTEPTKTKTQEVAKLQDEVVKNGNENSGTASIVLSKLPAIQQSTVSSEWNDDTPTYSSVTIPSMSISAAFKIVETNTKALGTPPVQIRNKHINIDPNVESTLSSVQPPSGLSAVSSTEFKRKTYTKSEVSNLFNQKPPPEFDLENSMISVASLKSEIAPTVDLVEEGMNELSLGVETYLIESSYGDGTDIDDSLKEDTESYDALNQGRKIDGNMSDADTTPTTSMSDRFLTYTKSHASPKQARRADPARYLTRTITPVDANGNTPSSTTPTTQFATFKVDKTNRPTKSTTGTSNESSPSTSPKGLRGRRKHLYSSLPPQRKVAPPIPPKPRGPVYVRPTRSSELRAALSSRESSPKQSKQSSRNSSTTSLNVPQAPARKIPPKPPVRTSMPSHPSKNFTVREVRNSNSSIGFINELSKHDEPSLYNTLPRSSKGSENSTKTNAKEKESKVGKLSTFWNHLTKSKMDNMNSIANNTKHECVSSNGNGNNGNMELNNEKKSNTSEKKTLFGIGFSFGKKKKDIWVRRENEGEYYKKAEKEKAFVHPFNYSNPNSSNANIIASTNNYGTSAAAASSSGSSNPTNSKMTTV